MRVTCPNPPAPAPRHLGALVPLLAVALGLLGGCGGSGPTEPGDIAAAAQVLFVVTDTAGRPVPGATVYLVPYELVNTAAITGTDILTGSAEDRDEPLEDAVRLYGVFMPRALTDVQGRAVIASFGPGRYFYLVVPSDADDEHLPGGSGCRLGLDSTVLAGQTIDVTVSSRPSAAATYSGTTVCLACHSDLDTIKKHAHRLGFAQPEDLTSLQDPSDHPGYTDGWDRFLPAATYTGGTEVWFSDYDPFRGFDKFVTTLADPRPARLLFVKAYLWRDTTDGNTFKITLENIIVPGDPRSPWTLEVPLTYGGALMKQRYLLAVPGREGHYPFLQFQTEGDDSRYDTTRYVYRDYHLDWFWDANTGLFKDPPTTATFEGNCTGCHSTGFTRFQDPMTLEWLSGARPDPNGAWDLDGNGQPDEINLGCEVCHGPGGDHINWVIDPNRDAGPARFIVTPQNLSPSRELMICGRCHDQVQGDWDMPSGEPLDSAREMAPPGISRMDYLAGYTTRPGPTLGDYWSDEIHSWSYRQQYSDMLKSPMHRNVRVLTVCSDCHGNHGQAPFRNQLKYDPDDPESLLCLNCHLIEVGPHSAEKTGFDHGIVATISCSRCHQPKTAKSGSGVMGKTKGTPTGDPSDVDIVYWENDEAAHHFVYVPRTTNPDVDGVAPGLAMPIPFTNSCGLCHDLNSISTPKPGSVPWAPEADGEGD